MPRFNELPTNYHAAPSSLGKPTFSKFHTDVVSSIVWLGNYRDSAKFGEITWRQMCFSLQVVWKCKHPVAVRAGYRESQVSDRAERKRSAKIGVRTSGYNSTLDCDVNGNSQQLIITNQTLDSRSSHWWNTPVLPILWVARNIWSLISFLPEFFLCEQAFSLLRIEINLDFYLISFLTSSAELRGINVSLWTIPSCAVLLGMTAFPLFCER